MADKIQRYPNGLIGSLAIVGGDGPKELSAVLAPVIDATDFYFSRDLAVTVTTVAGLTAADVGPSITVPQGEFWRLWGLSTAVTPSAAGTFVGVTHFFQNPPFGANLYCIVFPSPAMYTVPAGQTRVDFGGFLPRPILIPPGTLLQSATTVAAGGANTVTLALRALYQRLQA